MYQKQVNKTAVQSQHMIADALFSLMERKLFREITITEICNEAAIGRKTFYRNFEMKEDVIDFQLDQLCGQYRDEIAGLSKFAQLRHHMEFAKRHADRFIVLYRNGFHEMVRAKFAILLPETMPVWTADPVEQRYRAQYIISGIEAIERVWVERNFVESIDELVAIIQRAQDRQVPLE